MEMKMSAQLLQSRRGEDGGAVLQPAQCFHGGENSTWQQSGLRKGKGILRARLCRTGLNTVIPDGVQWKKRWRGRKGCRGCVWRPAARWCQDMKDDREKCTLGKKGAEYLVSLDGVHALLPGTGGK